MYNFSMNLFSYYKSYIYLKFEFLMLNSLKNCKQSLMVDIFSQSSKTTRLSQLKLYIHLTTCIDFFVYVIIHILDYMQLYMNFPIYSHDNNKVGLKISQGLVRYFLSSRQSFCLIDDS